MHGKVQETCVTCLGREIFGSCCCCSAISFHCIKVAGIITANMLSKTLSTAQASGATNYVAARSLSRLSLPT